MTPTSLRPLSLSAVEGIEIYLKDESAHPTGSMKYRLVRAMSCEAIASGAIKADRPVIAATSGAVAIAGAHFASLLGLDFTAVVPAKTPGENLARIEREGGRWQVGERPPAAVQEEARGLAERSGGHFLDHFTDAERAMAVCGEPTIADVYWSFTMRDHVVYESRLELTRLLCADFDQDVTAVFPQPFLLSTTVDGHLADPSARARPRRPSTVAESDTPCTSRRSAPGS